MNRHRFTSEQKEFIKKNVIGRSNKELTRLFNERFHLNLDVTKIRDYKKNNKLISGLDTRFKPKQKPVNYRPIGSEKLNAEGYWEIKVDEQSPHWRRKHEYLWELKNGPIPEGYVVIFGDRNRENFSLDNLLLVSRKQLLTMNRRKLIKNDIELTKTGILLADLFNKIRNLEREAESHV